MEEQLQLIEAVLYNLVIVLAGTLMISLRVLRVLLLNLTHTSLTVSTPTF